MPIRLQRQPYPLQPAPDPEVNLELADQIALSNLPPDLSHAPSVANIDVDVELLNALTRDWQDPNCHVASVIGDQTGNLIRAWIDWVLQDPSLPQPEGIFWWNFRKNPDPEAFFAAAWAYLTGSLSDWKDLSPSRFNALVGVLISRSYLLVLDGFDVMQYQEGDDYGITKYPGLRSLIHGLSAADHRCFCVITSQIPIFDLHNYVTSSQYNSASFSLSSTPTLSARGDLSRHYRLIIDRSLGHLSLQLHNLGSSITMHYRLIADALSQSGQELLRKEVNNIMLRDKLGDQELAIALQRQVLAVSNQLADPSDRAISHGNLSIYLARVGSFEESAQHLLAGIIYLICTQNTQEIQTFLNNLRISIRAAKRSNRSYPLPSIEILLSLPQFTPLATFLHQRSLEILPLQHQIDEIVSRIEADL